MIDTRNKRAAALGFGLAFLLVLPAAEGALSVESAGHALSAYRFDLDDVDVDVELPDGDIIMIPSSAVVLLPESPFVLRIPAETIVMMPRRARP